MFKKIIISLILLILVIFLTKDYLAKIALENFLNKKLSLGSEIGKARISLKGLSLEKVKISVEGLTLEIPHLDVSFQVSDYFFLKGLNIVVKNSSLVVSDLKGVKDKFDQLKQSSKKSAKLKKTKPGEFSFKLNLQNIDFSLKDEEADFKGMFIGQLILGVGSAGPGKLEGSFISVGPGDINFKKDSSLSGLKPYLDQVSYDTLLNSFKNYSYSWGRITITKDSGIILVGLNFDSPQSGKRNISFSLHKD
ncbi:MAG: hypothetical protein KJ619_05455 [Candidatus Omnitrophica bacterium]|nr:hypothetical protein [Candidatus Omnitrophota bacterium]MBU2473574.1 hypothetical protein [Candidatus Omnitrophota bacterium]